MDWEKQLGELIFVIFGSYLFFMDFKYFRLPDIPVFILLWMGLVLNINGLFTSLDSAVLGVIAGYGSLWLVFWIFKFCTGKDGLGYGDFKLLAALGAWFGWQELSKIIVIATCSGLIFAGFYLKLIRKPVLQELSLKKLYLEKLPLGSFILLAGFLEFFLKR